MSYDSIYKDLLCEIFLYLVFKSFDGNNMCKLLLQFIKAWIICCYKKCRTPFLGASYEHNALHIWESKLGAQWKYAHGHNNAFSLT